MKYEDYIMGLLPDELEKIKKLIDELLNNEKDKRLTNQEYLLKYKDIQCPKCGSTYIKKNGHKNGTQRFLCKICNKSFSLTTNTILEHTRITYQQLKDLIKGILNNLPISSISKEIKMSKTDTYYFEIKLFKELDTITNSTKLKGVVQADEKYFRISYKGTKHDKMPRRPRHSGSQDLAVGISNDQVCVVVAIDEHDNIEIGVAGNGPASTDMISKVLKGKIEEGSTLVTDSKSSYKKFASDNKLILKQIPSGEHTIEEIYNLGEVNELINELEEYVNHYKKGVSSKHLQQYCYFIKYRKILKYTYEYLDRNQKMYEDTILNKSTLTDDDISKMELPF